MDFEQISTDKFSRIIKHAIAEFFKESGGRPDAKPIIAWRQLFFIEGDHTIHHQLPIDPKVGEIWDIPTDNYAGQPSRSVSVVIDKVRYRWSEDRTPGSSGLDGWRLDIEINCRLSND